MSFQNCGLKQILRQSAPLSTTLDVTPGYIGDQNTQGLYFVAKTTGMTAGSCVVKLLVSLTGGTTYVDLPFYQQTITANGETYISVDGPVPAYIGIQLVPAVFDGSVEIDAYSSGRALYIVP
jgi:hypothetical protein